jgi:hypothetical protein
LLTGPPELIPQKEATAVFGEARESQRDLEGFEQPNLPEVFDLIFPDHRPHLQADKLFHWETVLGEKHHSNIGGLVEERRVSHVGVEIHVPPARDELFFEHSAHSLLDGWRLTPESSRTAKHVQGSGGATRLETPDKVSEKHQDGGACPADVHRN